MQFPPRLTIKAVKRKTRIEASEARPTGHPDRTRCESPKKDKDTAITALGWGLDVGKPFPELIQVSKNSFPK